MNDIKHIYANGCSFTNDDYIKHTLKQPCYPELLGQHYQVNVTNAGQPGSCNRRIIRNTLRDSFKFGSDTLVLLQLTFLFRTEKPYTENPSTRWKMHYATEEYHESIKDNPLEKHNQEFFKMFYHYYDECAEITNLATDLIMLTGYLRNNNIPYLIFPYQNLVQPQVLHKMQNNQLLAKLNKDSCILNIMSENLLNLMGPGNWYYDQPHGHLDQYGHVKAAEVLANLLDAQEL